MPCESTPARSVASMTSTVVCASAASMPQAPRMLAICSRTRSAETFIRGALSAERAAQLAGDARGFGQQEPDVRLGGQEARALADEADLALDMAGPRHARVLAGLLGRGGSPFY